MAMNRQMGKRENGQGSYRVRGKSVEFRWTVMDNGRPIARSLSEPVDGRTPRKLDARLQELIGQPKNFNPKETFGEVAQEWHTKRARQIGASVRRIEESTYETEKYTLKILIRLFGDRDLLDITPDDVDKELPAAQYEDVRIKKDGTVTRKIKRYGISQLKKCKGMMGQIYAYAVSTRRIKPAENPMLLVQPLVSDRQATSEPTQRKQNEEQPYYNLSEIAELVYRLPHNKFGDAYLVSIGCCLRGQELRARRVDDIAPDGSYIDIYDAVKRGEHGRDYLGLTKSEKGERLAAVPEFAQAAARRLREGALNGYIMPNKSGGHITYSTYRHGVAAALKKAGVRELSAHKARNSYITAMRFLIGEDVSVIMAESGHSDRATMEGYATVSFERRQQAAQKLHEKVMEELAKKKR